MVPARTGSPSAASRTRSWQRPLSRSANSLVNSSGMCCTISTGSGKFPEARAAEHPAPPARRWKRRWPAPSGLDEIGLRLSRQQVGSKAGARGRPGKTGCAGRVLESAPGPACILACQRMNLGNQILRQRCGWPPRGSLARLAWPHSPTPRRPALRCVTLAPRWVSELHMITGILCPRARSFLSVTNPSITGISTSSRIRSG